MLVRYGSFYQFVTPVSGGHVSVCIGPEAPVRNLIERIYEAPGGCAEEPREK